MVTLASRPKLTKDTRMKLLIASVQSGVQMTAMKEDLGRTHGKKSLIKGCYDESELVFSLPRTSKELEPDYTSYVSSISKIDNYTDRISDLQATIKASISQEISSALEGLRYNFF